MSLKEKDFEVYSAINDELHRQQNNIELIASENYVSNEVLEAQGSVLTNKYAEGYPQDRYYGGCQHVDVIETLAISRATKLFNVKYANVQPHSGSSANLAAYRAILKNGDVVMGMALDQGGHLTHGHRLNFSGIDYVFHPYYVSKETETIDYEALRLQALEIKPKLIVAGASCYSRAIDFKCIGEIAKEVGAYFMVDMAHIAGLVAAGLHQNPCDYADIVTLTTHKTLRGPRGGMILTNSESLIKKINATVFPGTQGGPLMHVIAAKATCFKEASTPQFKEYQYKLVENAKVLAQELQNRGYRLVSNGTDNHLLCVDVMSSLNMTGKVVEEILDKIGITVNKNTIPYDTQKPKITSGIRLGTAAVTTRGFGTKEMELIAKFIDEALRNYSDENKLKNLLLETNQLTKRFPLY